MVIGFDASRAFSDKRTGTENYSYELLQHMLLADYGNRYRIYLRNGMGQESKLLDRPNVQVVNITKQRLWTQLGLAKEVLLHKPSVLFIPAHTMPVLHTPKLKSVVTIHDLGAEYLPQYHQFPQKLYLNRSTEYAVKHASHLIAVSEATKRDLQKRLQADPAKITVVYEGFNQERFSPQPEQKVQDTKQKYQLYRPYVLFVGTVQPRKNLERLIEAYSLVVRHLSLVDQGQRQATIDELPMLVIAGKKGWLAEPIYAAPKKFGIEQHVRFLNYVADEDLASLYSGATVFAFPSLFEGFGIPVLEAMACGVPVLTSNVSSLPEVGGSAVSYVNPYEIGEMADSLQKLLTNEQQRAKLRELGFLQVKKFTWETTAAQTLSVLTSVAGGNKP